MTKKHITDLIVLGLLLGGLSLAWDDAADSVSRIGQFIAGRGDLTVPIQTSKGVGTLGIQG